MKLECKLWSINRWLRWTGFRIFIVVPSDIEHGEFRVGIAWYGIYQSRGWRRIEGVA